MTSILLMIDRKTIERVGYERIKKSINANLLYGTFLGSKLIAIAGATPWNPVEFLQDSSSRASQNQIWNQSPISALYYEAEMKLANLFLYDSQFEELRQKIKLNEIAIGGPMGVLYEYRGGNFGSETRWILLKQMVRLGYRLVVGWNAGPISAYTSIRDGGIPLPKAAIHYPSFIWKGQKPFEPLVFKSKVPQGDSSYYCGYRLINSNILQRVDEHSTLRSSL